MLFLRLWGHLEKLDFLVNHHRKISEREVFFAGLVPDARRLQQFLLRLFGFDFLEQLPEDLHLQALLEKQRLDGGDGLVPGEARVDGLGEVGQERAAVAQEVLDVVHLGQRLDGGEMRFVRLLDVQLQREAEGSRPFHHGIRVSFRVLQKEELLHLFPSDPGGMLKQLGLELTLGLFLILFLLIRVLLLMRIELLQCLTSAETSL